MEGFHPKGELGTVANAKTEIGGDAKAVVDFCLIVKGARVTVIPVEGIVPLDMASTEDIGACGGEEGIDGVLGMEGERPEEGQDAK